MNKWLTIYLLCLAFSTSAQERARVDKKHREQKEFVATCFILKIRDKDIDGAKKQLDPALNKQVKKESAS